jgi:hypothetical protein
MRTIKMFVESPNGHDTIEVPENKVQEEVEKQLKDDKWVTIENEQGTELLTEKDIPATKTINETGVEKTDEEKWAEKFENVKSVTATNKVKGG